MTTRFEVPTLLTPRLILRAFRPSDLDAFAAMNADPTVRHFLGGNLQTRNETWGVMAAALGQWALRGYGLFAVERDGAFIGRIGILHHADWPEPELAWGLIAACWGQGLATEGSAAVRDWACTKLRLSHLASFILPDNQRSRRVAEKLGAARQGQVAIRDLVAERWVHPGPGTGVLV